MVTLEKKLLVVLAILTLSITSFFTTNATAKTCETAEVKANGLVCDFCAQALEKVFNKQNQVSGIKVDLDSGLISVGFNKGKSISDEKLTKLIKDSGYDVVNIDRKNCS